MIQSKAIVLSLVVGLLGLIVSTSILRKQAVAKPAPVTFDERLLDIAKNYLTYGRVDDNMRVAPAACEAPLQRQPGVARFSASEDKDTHGKKLYSIFASNKMTYLAAKERKEQPVGQVLVKQSWTAEEVKTAKEDQKVI